MLDQAVGEAVPSPDYNRRYWKAAEDPARQIAALVTHPDIATVAELSARTGLEQPRLARLSRSLFGCTPKRMLCRARLLRMLRIMMTRTYAEWRDFLDPRYVDQSHFIREFRQFTGLSPSEWEALPLPDRAQWVDRIAAPFTV